MNDITINTATGTSVTTRTITVPFRRGTTAQNLAYLGTPGEITIDSTLRTIRVHDGIERGGEVLLRKSDLTDEVYPAIDAAQASRDRAVQAEAAAKEYRDQTVAAMENMQSYVDVSVTKADEASASATSAAEAAETAASKVADASGFAALAETAKTGAEAARDTADAKAGEASASAATAVSKANELAAQLYAFNELYIGKSAAHPTVDRNGNPLKIGAIYESTTDGKFYQYESDLEWHPYDEEATNAMNNAVLSAQSAAGSAAAADTSKTSAETAKTGAETARDAAVAAQVASEAARDAAVTAQGASEAARDGAVQAKTDAEALAGVASVKAGEAWDARDAAVQAAADAGAAAETYYYSHMDIGGAVPLRNAKPVRIGGGNLPAGDNDLYTVPAGRRCYITISQNCFFNPTGAAISTQAKVKVDGTYYTMTGTNVGANAGITLSNIGGAIVLEAGESFAVSTAAAGLNVRMQAFEFSADTPFFSPRLYSVTAGPNTLYIVPEGKTACYGLGFNTASARNGVGAAFGLNSVMGRYTGAAVTLHDVPQGATISAGTQTTTAGPSGTAIAFQFNAAFTSNEGDALVFDASASSSDALLWANVFEIDV